jgi:hypothetical protein
MPTADKGCLIEPSSQPIGDPSLSSAEVWAMSEPQQTRDSKMTDRIQTGVQELSATEASAIYELSATGASAIHELPATGASAIYDLSAADLNESDSEFSSLATPPELPIPEISTVGSGEDLIDVSPQQQGDCDEKNHPEALVHTSAVPEPASSSNTGSGKTMKTSTKDSTKPDAWKRPRTDSPTASNKIVVAIFGLTGTGKSSFISKLTGREVKIGHGLESCEDIVDTICQSSCN